MDYYTGVGSRKAPREILNQMTTLAQLLADRGYALRSGGAGGSDTAFERGAGSQAVIYLAENFMHKPTGEVRYYDQAPYEEARRIVEQTHPAWHRCNEFVRRLHTRNMFQVLGHDLNTFLTGLICWTPDGAQTAQETSIHTGGTGTAIRIADQYRVPVLNLARSGVYDRLIAQLT